MSIARAYCGDAQPVDYLRNLEEVADVKLECDTRTALWVLTVHPNDLSAGGFEPILHFGIPDDELEHTIRKTWLRVTNALTNLSERQLSETVTALQATVPKDCDPLVLTERWLPTPVQDTWESPEMVTQWKIERGYLRHFYGPITLKCYGIGYQFFAPSGTFLPVEEPRNTYLTTPSTRAVSDSIQGEAVLRATWRGLFTLLKWALTLVAVGASIVGIGYVFMHYLGYFIAAILVFSFLIGPWLSAIDD